MSDKIIRATAANSQVRVFVADTRELVQSAFEKHHTYPVTTAALGRTLTAAAMMSLMQKGTNDKLTIKIDGDGPARQITVCADSKANVKGFVANPDIDIPLKANGKLDVSGAIGAGTLTVIRDMGLKEPYVGTVSLVTGEIAEDITYYFTVSEQIPSSVGLGVLVDTDCQVKRAGGFILQLMPFADDAVIDALEKNIGKLKPVTTMLDEGLSTEEILGRVVEGFDYEINDEIVPTYTCECSRDRVRNALSLIAKAEIESMYNQVLDDGKPIEVHCDFCNTDYYFNADELKDILQGTAKYSATGSSVDFENHPGRKIMQKKAIKPKDPERIGKKPGSGKRGQRPYAGSILKELSKDPKINPGAGDDNTQK